MHRERDPVTVLLCIETVQRFYISFTPQCALLTSFSTIMALTTSVNAQRTRPCHGSALHRDSSAVLHQFHASVCSADIILNHHGPDYECQCTENATLSRFCFASRQFSGSTSVSRLSVLC